jgi:cyclase
VKHFELEEVHDGFHAAIVTPDGEAVGNAGFVDLGGSTLVFDTTFSRAAARDLRAAAERVAPVDAVVISHFHGDHVLGAPEFDAPLVSTNETRTLLETVARPRAAERGLELRMPDETFSGERTFAGTERAVRVITYGGGHTGNDAFLWQGEDRVLFAGDLVVVGTHPWTGDGNVAAWPGILERIEQLGPRTIVPGHGPVAGPEALEFMFRYLELLASAEPGAPNPYPDLDHADGWERNLQALASSA